MTAFYTVTLGLTIPQKHKTAHRAYNERNKTMPIKLTAESEAYILAAYHQGTKTEDIQAHLGITRASIYNVLKRNNLKPNRVGKPRQKLPISQKGLKRLADWWQEHKEQEDTVYHWLGVIAHRHLKGE